MWWRVLILLNVSFYNMMGNVFAAGISPLFGLIIEEFHCSTDEASRLASYALLMLGLSVSLLNFGLRLTKLTLSLSESYCLASDSVCGKTKYNLTLHDNVPGLQHMGSKRTFLQFSSWLSIRGWLFWWCYRSSRPFYSVGMLPRASARSSNGCLCRIPSSRFCGGAHRSRCHRLGVQQLALVLSSHVNYDRNQYHHLHPDASRDNTCYR